MTTPGPGQRIQRTAGQVGSVVILLTFVEAFDWFGSGSWTAEQSAAVLAVATLAASTVQNLVGHWRSKGAPTSDTWRIGNGLVRVTPITADETRPVVANFAGAAPQEAPGVQVTLDPRTAAQRFAATIKRTMDDIEAEMAATDQAADALAQHTLVGLSELRAIVNKLHGAGLSFDEIVADAEALGEAITKVAETAKPDDEDPPAAAPAHKPRK